MVRILFVCHGNICRSPMAEFVMKDMVQKAGLADRFYIASALGQQGKPCLSAGQSQAGGARSSLRRKAGGPPGEGGL